MVFHVSIDVTSILALLLRSKVWKTSLTLFLLSHLLFNLTENPVWVYLQTVSKIWPLLSTDDPTSSHLPLSSGFLTIASLFIYLFILYSRFLLVICFIHISVYMSIPISQFITPPPPPPLLPYICSLHLCLYFCLANWFICTIFLDSTYMRSYTIFVFLFSDFHSVRQSLGPSTSLQMTQFHSFLWLSNIPLYICTTSSLSIRLSMDI